MRRRSSLPLPVLLRILSTSRRPRDRHLRIELPTSMLLPLDRRPRVEKPMNTRRLWDHLRHIERPMTMLLPRGRLPLTTMRRPPERRLWQRPIPSSMMSRHRPARRLLTAMTAGEREGPLIMPLPQDHPRHKTTHPRPDRRRLTEERMSKSSTTGKRRSPTPRFYRRRPTSSAASTDRPPTTRRKTRPKPARTGVDSSSYLTHASSPRSSLKP